jgi:hypothetical protein
MYQIIFNKNQRWDEDSIKEALTFADPDCGFDDDEWEKDGSPKVYYIDASGEYFHFDIKVDVENEILTFTLI